jgi:hypothetical protein
MSVYGRMQSSIKATKNGSIRGDTCKKTVLLEDDSALYPLKRKLPRNYMSILCDLNCMQIRDREMKTRLYPSYVTCSMQITGR